ncbi:family 20 glycosylhydrolase [Actomonas aquatica]|uniref:Family 20 glycosylhydrolase n=1 Tax=Actomonas aquatica TaxID=2866162 RepID=A0ABZ1CDZ3_9BACT|nr:family 20 glycosylhydrolase [Opitutus sp. WL0086]WRQ89779.1 family 20 glycosylhydrolase [Opitutus sp. WL0086]
MIRAFQWDLARQVERLDWLLAQLPKYSKWGYNELYLHLEDAVDYPSLPGVARRDAYSWRQLTRLVTTAQAHGIGVVPIVNLLGHTQYLIKTPEWRDLNELRAADGSPLPEGQICPSHPRTLEVATKLLDDIAPLCTAGKVHVGLDESFVIGRHPLAREDVATLGLGGYFARYVNELHRLCTDRQLQMGIWADMLVLFPDAIAELPAGIAAYDWYYYAFGRSPRFEAQNFRAYDLAPKLRARGIDYWGCPMNGAFRHEPLPVFGDRLANAQSWWRRCRQVGASGFLVTGWEPNRLALETTMVVDAAIASLWLDDEDIDQVSMLERGFTRVYGKRQARERARLMMACDERAFSGYARWETHLHWDSCQGRDGAALYAADERFFARALHQPLPSVFAASLQWRHYLAARDRLIRHQAQLVHRARRLVHRDRRALLPRLVNMAIDELAAFRELHDRCRATVDTMWLSTRRQSQPNPNRRILSDDLVRLRELQGWWKKTQRDDTQLATASPVTGRWQLRLLVHTTHPNLQAVTVEIQQPDGSWRLELQRYLIEFRNHAARRRARLRHWLSLPLDSADTPVRIGLCGLGTFSISDTHLTDGVTEWRPSGRYRRVKLGQTKDPVSIVEVDRTQARATWQPRWVTQLQR